MSFSSVSSVNDLVAAIRSQLTAPAARAGRRRPASRTDGGAAKYADPNLGRLIETRVSAISDEDPQRGRKALRVFLEVVLLSHFGDSLVNSAAFHQMVADVQDAMEADPACKVLIGRAIAHLLGSPE